MARRGGAGVEYARTPEQIAQDQIRFANTMQNEEGNRLKVAARLNHRDALIHAGADERFLPAVSEITSGAPISDADYADKINRAVRFSNANARRNPTIMSDTLPGEGDHILTPGKAVVLPARGGEANVRLASASSPGANLNPPGDGTYFKASRYAGAPPEIQKRAAAGLGEAWQQDLAFNRAMNPAIVGDQDAMRIAAQYGGKGTIPEKGQVGYYDAKGNFLGPLYHPETGEKLPMPKGATGIRGTASSSAPDTAQGQREINAALPPTGMTRDAAFALGYSGEPSAIAAKPATTRTPYEAAYLSGYEGPRDNPGAVARTEAPTPGYQVGQAFRGGVDALAGLFTGGGGSDVASGVSRGQAARIQTPTNANPVPKTETSPAPDIGKTDQSTAPAPPAASPVTTTQQPLPDQWENKRYAFSGF